MKLLPLFLLLFFLSSNIYSQQEKSKKELKKEAAEKKKLEKSQAEETQFDSTGRLLISRKFVLEAEYLRDEMNSPQRINSQLNFIAVDSLNAVLQIGTTQRFGSNGLGGVTAHGRISNWRLEKNAKNKTYDLFMTIVASTGVYDVNMSVDYTSRANATLTRLTAGKLTFEGPIVPIKESSVFKGQGI